MSLPFLPEGFEPMQIDANLEENDGNDNDIDDGRPFVGLSSNGGGGAANGSHHRYDGDSTGSHMMESGDANFSVTNPSIDLEVYVQSYEGLALLYRLEFIARHCPLLRLEALRLALSHVMNTHNTILFTELHRNLLTAMNRNSETSSSGNNLPDVTAPAFANAANNADIMSVASAFEWAEGKNKKAALKLEKLDTDLKNYKSNSIKESIRRGHDDLGDHFLDCGDLANALKCYSRARDYCTSGRHVVNMCVNVVKVSIYLKNWTHVMSYVNKALATPDFAETTTGNGSSNKSAEHNNILTCLNCAYGLAELATRKYKSAARRFLNAQLDHCQMPDIMSPQNVAIYGGLCALATFDRSQLQKQVINSPSFKLFLELEPQLREVIHSFYESKYGKCLSLLDEMKDNLMLDIYLSSHVNNLYNLIRNRSLIQYFSPYLSADLHRMASSFNTSVTSLEDELMSLILDGKMKARIDSHNKVLFAQDFDQRSMTFEKAVEMSQLHQRRMRLAILRSAILRHGICIKGNLQQRGDVVDA